jgi:hypothetical protein
VTRLFVRISLSLADFRGFDSGVQYWRDLPDAEQLRVLPMAEEFFARCPTAQEVAELLPPRDYDRFLRVAEEQLEAAYDLPEAFSARARAGLLGTLVMCAASDARTGQTAENQNLAGFQMLLTRS